MKLNFDSVLPLYQQVASQIEEGILEGQYVPGAKIPSTTEISKRYNINPATVLKGMNVLVEKNVLKKRRGLGMFVTNEGLNILFEERKEQFFNENIGLLIKEAKGLNLKKEELLTMIESGYEDE